MWGCVNQEGGGRGSFLFFSVNSQLSQNDKILINIYIYICV